MTNRRAPLLGQNLVRMVYLDEGGISHNEPVLCVAGVMIHGDRQWRCPVGHKRSDR